MIRIVCLLLLSALPSSEALAWGSEGHRTIGAIAETYLTSEARRQVQALLGNRSLAEVSTWADEIRKQRPKTAPWHYVNIPIGAAGYDRARHCPTSDCVVEQIEAQSRILKDKSLLPAVREEALKWVVHLVGDVHQPLHAGDHHDRGGNDVMIRIAGRTEKLHALWDGWLIEEIDRRRSEPLAIELTRGLSASQVREMSSGSVKDWANEGHAIAARFIYPAIGNLRGGNKAGEPIVLGTDYVTKAEPLVRGQILKAGIRLAATLNAILH